MASQNGKARLGSGWWGDGQGEPAGSHQPPGVAAAPQAGAGPGAWRAQPPAEPAPGPGSRSPLPVWAGASPSLGVVRGHQVERPPAPPWQQVASKRAQGTGPSRRRSPGLGLLFLRASSQAPGAWGPGTTVAPGHPSCHGDNRGRSGGLPRKVGGMEVFEGWAEARKRQAKGWEKHGDNASPHPASASPARRAGLPKEWGDAPFCTPHLCQVIRRKRGQPLHQASGWASLVPAMGATV